MSTAAADKDMVMDQEDQGQEDGKEAPRSGTYGWWGRLGHDHTRPRILWADWMNMRALSTSPHYSMQIIRPWEEEDSVGKEMAAAVRGCGNEG